MVVVGACSRCAEQFEKLKMEKHNFSRVAYSAKENEEEDKVIWVW